MSSRDINQKKGYDYRFVITGLIFFFVTALFCYGISSVSSVADEKEIENIENAVVQSALFCYGTEGAYPESLDYLKEHYGLTYNEDKYVVRYEIIAKNIRPQVSVIRQKRKKQ